MSLPALKSMTTRMLTQLKKDIRPQVKKHPGQLFVFNVNKFRDTVTGYYGEEGFNETEAKVLGAHLTTEFQHRLLDAEGRVPKQWHRRLNQAAVKIHNVPAGAKIYKVLSYNTVNRIKNNIGKLFEESVDSAGAKRRVTGQVLKGESSKTAEGFHIGHGELGTAVSATKASAVGTILSNAKKRHGENFQGAEELSRALEEYQETLELKISLEHHQEVTATGKFTKNYTPVLSAQFVGGEKGNALDSIDETSALLTLKNAVKKVRNDILEQKGSPSAKDAIEAVLMHKFSKELKSQKNVKIKGAKPKSRVVSKGSAEAKVKKKMASKVPVIRGTLRDPKTGRFVSRSKSPINLVAMINAKLPQTVAKNMGTPKLNYQTGRFAYSTKVVNAIETPTGMPSFGYTYQRDPYQVFEMGLGVPPWATPDRDPRLIIDQSIREIAATMALGRLSTRRV